MPTSLSLGELVLTILGAMFVAGLAALVWEYLTWRRRRQHGEKEEP